MEKYQTIEQLTKIIEKHQGQIEKFKIIKLNGQLGAGKTTFVKLYGKMCKINETINSPTYNILKVYKTADYQLVHVDAYRVLNEDIGLFDYFLENNTQIFIEWAEKINEFIPQSSYLEINIKFLDKTTRQIQFKEFNG